MSDVSYSPDVTSGRLRINPALSCYTESLQRKKGRDLKSELSYVSPEFCIPYFYMVLLSFFINILIRGINTRTSLAKFSLGSSFFLKPNQTPKR